jgi:hypothetical protein
MKKLITRIVVGILVLAVVAIFAVWAMIDPIAKKGVEVSGEYALGVPTKLGSLNLSLLGGTLKMDALGISNPAGFTSPHLMKSGAFDLGLRTASVLGEAVELTHFTLDGLDVNIEQQIGKSNVSVVMDHVKQLGGGGAAKPESKEGGKKVKVDKVTIKNVTAHVRLLSGPAVDILIPSIELNNVGSGGGAKTSEIINRIVMAVLAGIVEKGKGIIPADLAGTLSADIASAANAVGGEATKLVGQAKEEAVKAVQGAASQAAQTVGKTAEEAKKGLGDLLNKTGGQKK